MKKLLFILVAFASFNLSFAQDPPSGMVKVVEISTDEAYASYVAARAQNSELRTVPGILVKEVHKNEVVTNHQILPGLLKEFYDGAVYYKVNYGPELTKLKQVVFIDTENYGFLGEVSKDGSTITLNSSLLQYPNLTRVIFLRQMGNLYGLKNANINSHEIMSEHWEIDAKHEKLATNLKSRPTQRERFFECLANKKPLRKQI